MSQFVYVGTNAAPQTGLYGGSSPIDYEEGGTNGFGVRMTASRVYKNWFTQPFTGGSREVTEFGTGHLMVFSVSNLTLSPGPSNFTWRKLSAGTYDTDIINMFTRICGIPYDSNVAGGSTYGGKTQPSVVFLPEHEVDAKGVDGTPGNLYYDNGWKDPKKFPTWNPGAKDTAADYVAAWKHLKALWVTTANANSVATSRIQFCLCFTSYGFHVKRVDPYYPGAGQVDILGSDPYLPPNGTDVITDVAPYAIKWNLPVGYAEFNCAALDSSTRATAFTNAFNTLANETRYTNLFVCIWNAADSSPTYNFNKIAGASAAGHSFPLTHAAIASGITTLGGNGILAAVGQALPSSPSLLSCVSNSAGTQITLTWDNPPSGDNVTGWNVYLVAGTTTTLTKINTTLLTAGTRSYVFTVLKDGTAIRPGTAYSCNVVAINSAGNSGYGLPTATGQITTQQPGGGNNPAISVQTAVNDPSNINQIDFTITATSPLSRPLTISHVVTGPAGVSDTFTGASVTRIYSTSGTYTDTVTVADNATPANTTATILTFTIPVSSAVTPLIGLALPPSGEFPSGGLGGQLRGNFQILDTDIGALQIRQTSHNAKYDLSGSNFSPDNISTGTTLTAASGNIVWLGFTLEDTQFSQLLFYTSTAQGTGTGAQVSVHDANGVMLRDFNGTPSSGTGVDGGFQTTAGPIVVPLGFQVSGRTYGETLFAQIYWPAGLGTYPVFCCDAAPAGVSSLGVGTGTPLWAKLTGATGINDPLPFGSYASGNQMWVGVQ